MKIIIFGLIIVCLHACSASPTEYYNSDYGEPPLLIDTITVDP